MKIAIDNSKNIHSIQSEFSSLFPYLKIEFFSKPHTVGKGTQKKFMKEGGAKLIDNRQNATTGEITFDGNTTVAELEQLFAGHFGLFVQVFRKSGRLWLETTATDNWTLNYQNEQGKELSNHTFSSQEENDYHEQE